MQYFSLFKWELLMSSLYFSNMSHATINIFKYMCWCFLIFLTWIPINHNVGSNRMYVLNFYWYCIRVLFEKIITSYTSTSSTSGPFFVTGIDCYHSFKFFPRWWVRNSIWWLIDTEYQLVVARGRGLGMDRLGVWNL